jgi:hypothetical protein
MPLDSLLLERWWFGAALVGLTLISDRALTLWAARLLVGARARVAIEEPAGTGPNARGDVDSGRLVDFRFLIKLGTLVGLAALTARFGALLWGDTRVYLFLAGYLILAEVPIHIRHASSIVRFYLLQDADAVRGQITYSLWYLARASSVEFFSFSALFLLDYFTNPSWFLLGGSARCASIGVIQLLSSRKPDSVAPIPVA